MPGTGRCIFTNWTKVSMYMDIFFCVFASVVLPLVFGLIIPHYCCNEESDDEVCDKSVSKLWEDLLDHSTCYLAFDDAFDGIADLDRYVDPKKAVEYAKEWNSSTWEEFRIRFITIPGKPGAVRVPERWVLIMKFIKSVEPSKWTVLFI